jgi:hypothetical protein
MMVSSVSLGHAATNPEVRGNESPPASGDPKVLNHLLDGLTHKVQGIANRLIFESRFDAKELGIPSGGIFVLTYSTTQTTRSSTP